MDFTIPCAEWPVHHASICPDLVQSWSGRGRLGVALLITGEGRGVPLGSQTPENRAGGGGQKLHLAG